MSGILAISGKKQSGKNTLFGRIRAVNAQAGIPTKEFSFAYLLKRMCVDILGLTEAQAFGTDDDKNLIVPHLLWENFPVPVWDREDGTVHVGIVGGWSTDRLKSGAMTGREVLQYWGTEIFRKAYGEVWVCSCLRQIALWRAEYPEGVAVITDCRFPNEAAGTQRAGGWVLRLTRSAILDNHFSETALDTHSNFDAVLDNSQLTEEETWQKAHEILRGWEIVN